MSGLPFVKNCAAVHVGERVTTVELDAVPEFVDVRTHPTEPKGCLYQDTRFWPVSRVVELERKLHAEIECLKSERAELVQIIETAKQALDGPQCICDAGAPDSFGNRDQVVNPDCPTCAHMEDR